MKRASFNIGTEYQAAQAPAPTLAAQFEKIATFLRLQGREDLIPVQPKRTGTRGYAVSWR